MKVFKNTFSYKSLSSLQGLLKSEATLCMEPKFLVSLQNKGF
ncbi:MAG: hypothetical protein ACRC1T_06890 [Clostridium chrysemydis]|nr:hypothetical protein [Clostridium sp. LY3-2]